MKGCYEAAAGDKYDRILSFSDNGGKYYIKFHYMKFSEKLKINLLKLKSESLCQNFFKKTLKIKVMLQSHT